MKRKDELLPKPKPKRTHPWRTQYPPPGIKLDTGENDNERRDRVVPYQDRMGIRK